MIASLFTTLFVGNGTNGFFTVESCESVALPSSWDIAGCSLNNQADK